MDKSFGKEESGFSLSDELFTVSEVAVILKLNEQTIRNWISAGCIPALRIGRRVRIRREVPQDILTKGLPLEDPLLQDSSRRSRLNRRIQSSSGRPVRPTPQDPARQLDR